MIHPWIIGELALGNLDPSRARILADLRLLPSAPVVSDDDVLSMIDEHGLAGEGIGWVDAHLLASARRKGVHLWSHDTSVIRAARTLQL
jgi:hypothetical protein